MNKPNPQFLASLCQSQSSLTKNGHADVSTFGKQTSSEILYMKLIWNFLTTALGG